MMTSALPATLAVRLDNEATGAFGVMFARECGAEYGTDVVLDAKSVRTEFLETCRGGVTCPVSVWSYRWGMLNLPTDPSPLALLLDLERRDFDIQLDDAGELVVEPRDALTADDQCGLARHREELRRLVAFCLGSQIAA